MDVINNNGRLSQAEERRDISMTADAAKSNQTTPGNPAEAKPVVAILGAGGGIGSALSRTLAAEGYGLLLGGRQTETLGPLSRETGGVPFEVDGCDFEKVEDRIPDILQQLKSWRRTIADQYIS